MFTSYCKNFMMYISQILMLYFLNIYSDICELCLNKAGRKIK